MVLQRIRVGAPRSHDNGVHLFGIFHILHIKHGQFHSQIIGGVILGYFRILPYSEDVRIVQGVEVIGVPGDLELPQYLGEFMAG